VPTFNDKNFNLRLYRSKKHIRWLIDQGIAEGSGVLMIADGLGEGYFLDDKWHGMAKTVAEAADGKVPTMIGLFELSAKQAAKKARYAADAGAVGSSSAEQFLVATRRYSLSVDVLISTVSWKSS